jgi:glycosyltransferase involved in cell wall biosynthesis
VKVSVITVVYNNQNTIAHTIQSVLSQSYPHIEYIIIDGQSTDNTLAIVRSFNSQVIKWISEPDRGIYDAMNKGILKSTGEVIGFLNADDFYASTTTVEKIVNTLLHTQADSVYGDLAYTDPNDTTKINRYWRSGSYKRGSFLYGWMPPHPTFFVKRCIYDTYGLFDLRFSSAADYELYP